MDREFEQAWSNVRDEDDATRCVAASTLVALRDQLPGAVFVRIPAECDLCNPVWKSVVEGSKALCACGMRRLILPTRGRALPAFTNQHHIVSDQGSLVIGPWGSDVDAAYVSFRVENEMLIGRHFPFGEQPLYQHENWALQCTELLRPNEQAMSLTELETVVRNHGGNVCMQPLGRFTVPICMIEGVSVAFGRVPFRVDNSVTIIGSSELDCHRPHRCS